MVALVFLIAPAAKGQSGKVEVDCSLSALERPELTASAAQTLTAAGLADKSARARITARLPALMARHPEAVVWEQEAMLAARFKVVHAIPLLVARLVEGDTQGVVVRASRSMRLEDDPAGTALIQMGSLSLLTMRRLVDRGDLRQRRKAALVLANINTPKAQRILCARLSSETDPFVLQIIHGSCTG